MTRHNERCVECKKTVKRMLEKIYGEVRSNYKIDVGSRPEDFKDSAFYEILNDIYLELTKYRGHADFIKVSTLPRVDLFIPNPGFVVEFDESQHFTKCREMTLLRYPSDLKVGFKIKKWIELCKEIKAKDNDPPYRDEQRAWYDTLRDFIPPNLDLRSTIRLFSKDYKWCDYNHNLSSDIERFKEVLRSGSTES